MSIDTARESDTTIAALGHATAPKFTYTTPRIAPIETTVYRLTNVTLQYVAMEHDADYHLVIADANGATMIVESPDPSCATAALSTLTKQMQTVRGNVNNFVPTIPAHPNKVVTVEGVGFFDLLSGTFGQAPNGIELHPVTAICFGSNCKL